MSVTHLQTEQTRLLVCLMSLFCVRKKVTIFSAEVYRGLFGGLSCRIADPCSTASTILRRIRTVISFDALCDGDVPPLLVEVGCSAESLSKRSFPLEKFLFGATSNVSQG